MDYSLKEISDIAKVYHEVEITARDFLFISASAMKNKEHQKKSAEKVLEAIEKYNQLPKEVRKELEKDTSANVSKIIELEKLCNKTITKK